MRRPLLVILPLLVACQQPDTSSPASTDTARASTDATQDVLATIRAYDEAWNRQDTVGVSQRLAAGYIYFSSRGGTRTRESFIGELLGSPDYKLEAADRSELEVHLYGTTAVVSTRWRGHGTYAGKPFRDDQRCSLVLARATAEWRIVSEHCTQIVPS